MCRNLLKSGAKVVIWNRTPDTAGAKELVAEGATVGESPAAVVAACAVTFAIVSDPKAAESLVFMPKGVLEGMGPGKAYVDVSTVDADTSLKIGDAITAKGGRFLEAPVSGSKKPAIDAQLIFLSAGDKSLFDEVAPALAAMGKKSFFLGAVGAGARMKLVVNMMMGTMVAALSEGLALAEACDLSKQDVLDVLDLGAMACPLYKMKGPGLVPDAGRSHPPAFPLKHQQKDMRLALQLGDELAQALPVAAAANEAYKRARAAGQGDADFAAVYEAIYPAKK